MRKSKQSSDMAGDWSTTGTFLRKPNGGWLHDESELKNGRCVDYTVQYLGSVIVNSSMRTLQFNVRTQVTKEAILRLAENSGNVYLGKKKKVPKQVEKILGGMDLRWAGDANLGVSVDSLKIGNEDRGMVILNHALPSISFASGGDGATSDYIGYVAKDPVHGRACHVFECPGSSQQVLATIGQAFELRYKMYLNSPRSSVQPVDPATSWDSDAWRHGSRTGDRVIHTTADIRQVNAPRAQPISIQEEEDSGGIYSDIPDLPDLPPPDQSPPPIPSARYTLAERPQRHSNGHVPAPHPHLDNPYDTMEISVGEGASALNRYSDTNIYDDAEVHESVAITSINGHTPHVHEEGGEYSTTFISIRQSRVTDDKDKIDITPPLARKHDYSNVGGSPMAKKRPPVRPAPFQQKDSSGRTAAGPTANGAEEASRDYSNVSSRPSPPLSRPSPTVTKPSPKPSPPVTRPSPPSSSSSKPSLPVSKSSHPASKPPLQPTNSYEHPSALKAKPPIKKKPTISPSTTPGLYDDPDEIVAARKKIKPTKPSRENIVDGTLNKRMDHGPVYDFPEEGAVYNTAEGVYDDPLEVPVKGGGASMSTVPPSPKFDDGIYMDANDSGAKKISASKQAASNPLPDPLAPLPQQRYFHGAMSRVEAEAMLMADGEFLIRESTKKMGQFVLTGMATGKSQHLLLMDKEGRVKSKDREFESVPHLIKHFMESKLPLVIGNSQVYLKKPIINAFFA